MKQRYLSDRPAKEDDLGRLQFAKSLGCALVSVVSDEGFVVGIEGGWGSGKSSVIEFIKKSIMDDSLKENAPILIEFNPWLVSNTGALVEALIAQIASVISSNLGNAELGIKTGEKLLRYVGLIRNLKYLKYVPGASWAGHAAEDVGALAETMADAAKGTQEILADVRKLLPEIDLLKKKLDVANSLKEINRPIIVIVDDIDRLPPEEIRVVVQAIKSVADFPRITYLLAYDREVVARALGQGNDRSGNAYLEKIVQVTYPIPPLFRYQLKKFLSTKIEELLLVLGIELRHFEISDLDRATGLLSKLLRHPRDVVRLMNRLIFVLPAVYSEVNLLDVIVLEALSQTNPSVREMVHSHPEDFIGEVFRGDIDVFDPFSWIDSMDDVDVRDKSPAWEKYLPSYEDNRKTVKEICDFLFVIRGRKDGIVPEDNLRISDPDRLARYFRMSSLENVPEVSDIHRMLRNPEELTGFLMNSDDEELRFQLEWVYSYLPSCSDPKIGECIDVLLKEAENRSNSVCLSENLAKNFRELMERLLRRESMVEREKIFELVAKQAPLDISEHILRQAVKDLGMWSVYGRSKEENDHPLIENKDVVLSAIKLWSERVLEVSQNKSLHKQSNLRSILYRYAQFNDDYDAVYDMVYRICETEAGLENFLSYFNEDGPYDFAEECRLISDPVRFSNIISSSTFAGKYKWLSDLLLRDDVGQQILNNMMKKIILKK